MSAENPLLQTDVDVVSEIENGATGARILAEPRSLSAVIFGFVELMKPELTSLSVFTALCGFYLAHIGAWSWSNVLLFLVTALGTLLVGGGAGALNEYIERGYDAEMKRTEKRPLPSARISPNEGLIFGISISVAGVLMLTLLVNVLTGFLASLTLVTYLFFYTPMKRISPFSTLIGGIPGAIPPMMGWAAVRNEVTVEAWVLFAILFLWQMPHFYSLAWMYRKDYSRAGYKMLTVFDESGRMTSRQIIFNSLALVLISVIPTVIGMTRTFYFIGAAICGFVFLTYGLRFMIFSMRSDDGAMAKTNLSARKLFFASLWYLPALLTLMAIDKQ
jgi:protoheme IX farnesyltransferase